MATSHFMNGLLRSLFVLSCYPWTGSQTAWPGSNLQRYQCSQEMHDTVNEPYQKSSITNSLQQVGTPTSHPHSNVESAWWPARIWFEKLVLHKQASLQGTQYPQGLRSSYWRKEGTLKSVSHGLHKILAMALNHRNHLQSTCAGEPVTAATGTAMFTYYSLLSSGWWRESVFLAISEPQSTLTLCIVFSLDL